MSEWRSEGIYRVLIPNLVIIFISRCTILDGWDLMKTRGTAMEEKHTLKATPRPKTTNKSHLTPSQIAMIEEAIAVIGEYGEVHLVVDRGHLHYITAQKSFNARNYSPGMIITEFERKNS